MRIMDERIVKGAPWRKLWQPALFRDALFYVESDGRSSGRRVALHEYPKRNIPYAEDMGRKAVRVQVQGYIIGAGPRVDYVKLKDALIEALEKDGPGRLRLPMIHKRLDMTVMVQGYTVTESRERGGMCTFDMDFIEYGDPEYRSTISTPQQIEKSAAAAEVSVMGKTTETTAAEVKKFREVHDSANIGGEGFGGAF